MSFSLSQEELVRLFRKNCNKKISTLLQIQQFKTFEDAISQAKSIEEVMVQNGELKLTEKEAKTRNENRGYNSNKNGSNNNGKA